MKKIYLISIIIFSVVLIAASGGVGAEQEKDRSGSPDGDNVCSQCHSSGSFSPEIELFVFDGQGFEVSSYIPGETYTLVFESSSNNGQASVYGFQCTSLFDDLSNAGTLMDTGAGTQVETVTNTNVTNRVVLEHSTGSSSGSWEGDWTAPESGNGQVTFYYSTVAANGNGMSSGDGYAGGTKVLSEESGDNVGEFAENLLKYTSDENGISLFSEGLENLQSIDIYSISGKQVYQNRLVSLPYNVDSSTLESGIYILNAFDGFRTHQFKLLIQ